MKTQRYHLLLIVALFFLVACGSSKKSGCNTCPNFSSAENISK